MTSYWSEKLAVVCGASSGLGMHLALELAHRGARLALIGRDRERLADIQQRTLASGASSVDTFSMDVADTSGGDASGGDAERFRTFLESNSLDLLINAVGRSDRGMLCDLKEEDLLDQIRVNVLSTFRMTRACWSSLERGHGCIINIASLAGIVAGPGLGGYPLAKHALVAMHRQWRSEAVGSGVHFLLVCPGPIDRNDSLDRYADLVAERGLDQQRARPGGGVKLERLDPTQLSARILNAAERRELELVVPGKVKWLAALMPLWPRWADSILRKKF